MKKQKQASGRNHPGQSRRQFLKNTGATGLAFGAGTVLAMETPLSPETHSGGSESEFDRILALSGSEFGDLRSIKANQGE